MKLIQESPARVSECRRDGAEIEGTKAGEVNQLPFHTTSLRPQNPRHRKFLYRHYKRSKADSIVWKKKKNCTPTQQQLTDNTIKLKLVRY